MIDDIDGNHRTHFGAAVAFERRDSEFFFERFRERGPQLFGAHQKIANASELLARALAQIAQAESRRGKEQRRMMLAREFADGLGVGWIGMKHRFEAV